MAAVLTRAVRFLLLFALAAASVLSTGPATVRKPFNLKKISYNFNTTLHWDYDTTSITPYFQVEYKDYKQKSWITVETCENISHKYCDLSEKIDDPYVYYTVRVKAFVGSAMSDYAKAEFYLINDGVIGPPTLNGSVDGKFIYVDIWNPPADGTNNVGYYVNDLTYDVYYGNETEEPDECDNSGCSLRILITNQSKYCFSAQGKSDSVPMTMEKSKEICIPTNVMNGSPDHTVSYAIGFSVLGAVIILLVASFLIIKRKIQAKTALPVSMNTIAKTVRAYMNMPSGQTTKYDQVSISPIDSDKMIPEEAEKELSGSDDPDNRENIDHSYQSSVGETEQRAPEEQEEHEESGSNKNYYRTENGDSSIACVVEDDVAEQPQPPRDIKPVPSSFGYDKPHCAL